MVDVSGKERTLREAEAAGRIALSAAGFAAAQADATGKGDVIGVARLAGIQAAKRTSDWIPLCHQVPLESIEMTLDLDVAAHAIEIRALARARAVTGVEMEALVAVTAAALTLYDMIKAVDRAAVIGPVALVRKSGGRRGDFRRPWPPQGQADSRGDTIT